MLLTKTFSADEYARALESWRWLGVEGKTPVLTSPFGDVFLQDAAGYWYLDTLESVTVMPFVVIMRVLGQVHHQADALPPGTAVYGLDVDDMGNVSLRTTP